ncbi:Heat shock protein HslJ [Halopseudomonas xinjiangensis]|uniref:Heat shock protein HslJ n=1 Tax=Halopseudomonas xinjiangensis TaxID=487184 RepID=A0A1H1X167_9GAMM|nr:META domain-containing protein [Halopseudomonas xinjiangensis]SDT02790.1 Heat shock protein HslJ [Halopseudomonas xinjiangensis]
MKMLSCAVLLTLLALTAGCSDTGNSPPAGSVRAEDRTRANEPLLRSITGSLSYRARIALPPESHALIELRDAAAQDNDDSGTLASQRIDLIDRQVPVGFKLEVPPEALRRANAYILRATIFERGKPAWLSEPLAINHRVDELDVGEMLLLPRRGAAFSSILECGRLQISAGYAGDDLLLEAFGERHVMLPVPSASGARYQAEGEPSTTFWTEGDAARLTLHGQAYPLCVAPGGLALPFRAFGHDPAWHLEINQQGLHVGEPEAGVEPVPYRISGTDNSHRTARSDDGSLVIEARKEPCRDPASGLVYPHRVELQEGDRRMQGCGGDPLRLLQGAVWQVEHIDGEPILEQTAITLEFRSDNRLVGVGSCNNFTGEYQLGEEGLTFSQALTTMKACAPEILEQERRFLRSLEGIGWFDLDRDGELLLQGDDNRSIRAREQATALTAAP